MEALAKTTLNTSQYRSNLLLKVHLLRNPGILMGNLLLNKYVKTSTGILETMNVGKHTLTWTQSFLLGELELPA